MTATATEQPRRRYAKAVRGELLTGHRVKPTLGATGYYLIEREPGGPWLFSHDPQARAIVDEHNRLAELAWRKYDRMRNREPQPEVSE